MKSAFRKTGLMLVPLVFGLVFAGQAKSSEEESGQLNCQFIGPIQGIYVSNHINFSPKKKKQLTPQELEDRTIEQYIKKLDASKIYFLESDIKDIKKMMKGIVAKVEKRPPDCSMLKKVHELFLKRMKERSDFAESYLGKDFKFKKETKLTLDPDEREYAKSKKEADEFQKKYIQFQISTFLATDMPLAEAKEKLTRRYERNYKQIKDFEDERVYSNYLDSFSRSMDPHSSYFSADTLDDFRINMSLSLEGIGATLTTDDGFTTIEQLIPGGAAARDGTLRPKDKIIAVAQGEGCQVSPKTEDVKKCEMENVVEMELRDVVKRIRGKTGSKVHLSVLRGAGKGKENFVVTLMRDKVKLEDDAASINYLNHEVNGKKFKVGVIDLPSFYADSKEGGRTSAGDLKKILQEARKEKVDGIVLDFSSNGGGSLDDAVKIAGLFFKTGAVVKQSAKKGKALELSDEDKDVDWAGPMVVLTSRISASASEIVAGTLKDYNRAVIVGADHTFGKGTVQSVIPLPPGYGAAKVTVGMFYTAGGNSTQHRGVDAHIVLPGALSTDEVGEKILDYSLPPSAVAPFLSKSAYVDEGEDAWRPVTADEINKLKHFSELRVAHNEEFKKITEEVKKAEAKDHVIDISEAFDQKAEIEEKEKALKRDKFGNLTKEARLAEYLKRPDIREAVNVVGDLVALRQGIELRLGAANEKSEPKNAPVMDN